jgi:hypothetical protein
VENFIARVFESALRYFTLLILFQIYVQVHMLKCYKSTISSAEGILFFYFTWIVCEEVLDTLLVSIYIGLRK